MFGRKNREFREQVSGMLVQLNVNQLAQNRIINGNRIAIDDKLWEINPSQLQVKYDELNTNYEELARDRDEISDAYAHLVIDFTDLNNRYNTLIREIDDV